MCCCCIPACNPEKTTAPSSCAPSSSRMNSSVQSDSLAAATPTEKYKAHVCTVFRVYTLHYGERESGVFTCRCLRVKLTGSVKNTRLDSLFMEAEITWELTARVLPPDLSSTSVFTVAFWVDRKGPRFL